MSAKLILPPTAYKLYRALVTQANDAGIIAGPLVVGAKYTIDTFEAGDDFSNVGSDNSPAVFVATGTTPTDWSNGSSLTKLNPPTSLILENTLGAVPVWSYVGQGNYSLTLANSFDEDKTFFTGSFASDGSIVYGGVLTNPDVLRVNTAMDGILNKSAIDILSIHNARPTAILQNRDARTPNQWDSWHCVYGRH